jgi:hypothetical protein
MTTLQEGRLTGVEMARVIGPGIGKHGLGQIKAGDAIAVFEEMVRKLAGAAPEIEHLLAGSVNRRISGATQVAKWVHSWL